MFTSPDGRLEEDRYKSYETCECLVLVLGSKSYNTSSVAFATGNTIIVRFFVPVIAGSTPVASVELSVTICL